MADNTIEQDVLDFIGTMLTEPVYMERPVDPVAEYVLVEKTGSGKANQIMTATFAMQSISKTSLLKACELNEKVKVAAEALVELGRVSRSAVVTDYNYTDTSRKEYRYQAVVQITHY